MTNSDLVYKLKNDDILYFDHIPKAAGTSFTAILDEHFDAESICPQQLWDELLPALPRDFSKFRLIRGHLGYGAQRIFPKKPIMVTMLREPIARSISWYDFVSNSEKKWQKNLWNKSHKLLDLLNQPNEKNSFENIQTRFLSKDLPVSFPDQEIGEQLKSVSSMFLPSVDISDLELAKKHLSEFTFFGLTERFEDSIFLLCYTFCWRPIRHIVRKMIGSHENTLKDISPEIMDTLKKITELDTDLYNFAGELFELRFNRMVNELKEKYYEKQFGEQSFQQMMFEMLEKHYEANYDHKIKNSINYNFREGIDGRGWNSREKGPDGVYFREIGKEPAEIDFPLLEKQQYKIQVLIHKVTDQNYSKDLEFKINDQFIDSRLLPNGKLFEGIIPESCFDQNVKFTRIILKVNYTNAEKTDWEYSETAPIRIKISPIKKLKP